MIRQTHVRNGVTGELEARDWRLPVTIIVCEHCLDTVSAVSDDAANLALWDHYVARHLTAETATGTLPDTHARMR